MTTTKYSKTTARLEDGNTISLRYDPDFGPIELTLPGGKGACLHLPLAANITSAEANQEIFNAMLLTDAGREHSRKMGDHIAHLHSEINRVNEEWTRRYADSLRFPSRPTTDTDSYYFGFFFGAMGAIGIGILIGGLLIGR